MKPKTCLPLLVGLETPLEIRPDHPRRLLQGSWTGKRNVPVWTWPQLCAGLQVAASWRISWMQSVEGLLTMLM